MKTFFASLLYVLLAIGASAQYYYKDIHQTQQSSRQLLSYKENKVTTVNVQSFEADGQPTAGFQGSQRIHDNYQMLITELQSALSGSSLLTSYFSPEGRLQKTVDT